MTNYRDDQFSTSSFFMDGDTFEKNERVNPQFRHTPGEIREFDVSKKDSFGLSPFVTKQLKRGFMRSLVTDIGKIGNRSAPRRYRLRFQFNPSTLQQNVEARQDMYLSILQDPYQLAQPVAASTSFSFELLFDRTHELMNGGPKPDLEQIPGQSSTTTSSGSAGDIGVLADLSVLYAIIGQGFTSETLTGQFEIFKQNARREYERAVTSGDLLFTMPEYDEQKKIYKERTENGFFGDDQAINDEKFGQFFRDQINKVPWFMDPKEEGKINIGNSAFLVPMPMRIVFSSLYMIDGYVTSTNVIFTKFNTRMVPTQCRVLLNIHAVYIGFARDQTFLTKSIEDAGNAARKQLKENRKELKEFCKTYGPLLQKYIVSFGDSAKTFLPDAFKGDPRNNPLAYSYAVNGDSTHKLLEGTQDARDIVENGYKNYQPAITTGFAGAGGTTVYEDKGTSWGPFGTPNGNPFNTDYTVNGGIHTYYEDGGSAQITREATVSVYGPFNSEAEARAAGRDNAYLVGQFTDSRIARDKNSWLSGKTVAGRQTGAFSVSGNKTNANSVDSSLGAQQFFPEGKNYGDLSDEEKTSAKNQMDAEYGNKYFAFYANAVVETTVGGDPDSSGSSTGSSDALIVKGNENMQGKTLSISLPSPCIAPDIKDDSPYINPDRIDNKPPSTRIPNTK